MFFEKIDIIILSNTADEIYHNLLSTTVNSIKEQTNIQSNIILVETNTEYKTKEQYNLPIDVLVVPNEKFNFNRFLNHGLKYSTADYICFSNNDVRYYPDSLYYLIEGLQTYDSVCPFALSHAPLERCYKSENLMFSSNLAYYKTTVSFLGWCYCFTRKTMNECFNGKFDERFMFWCQDHDVVQTLLKTNAKHAVIGLAKAQHQSGTSHALFKTKEERHQHTYNMYNVLAKKYYPFNGVI